MSSKLCSGEATRRGLLQGPGRSWRWNGTRVRGEGAIAGGNMEQYPPKKRFYLAEEAPMCSGPLRGSFGYNAVSPIAKMILDGTFEYPPDLDKATKEILQECARIRLLVPKDSVGTGVTKEDWHNHWGRTKEETSRWPR